MLAALPRLPQESRSPRGGEESLGFRAHLCSHSGQACSGHPRRQMSSGRWAHSVAATEPWPCPRGPCPTLTHCPSLQGLFVLLFYCVLNREVRKHLKGVLAGKKPHPDDSATTRATLLTVGGTRGPHRAWGLGCTAHQGSVWVSGPSIRHGSVGFMSPTKGASQSRPQSVASSLVPFLRSREASGVD